MERGGWSEGELFIYIDEAAEKFAAVMGGGLIKAKSMLAWCAACISAATLLINWGFLVYSSLQNDPASIKFWSPLQMHGQTIGFVLAVVGLLSGCYAAVKLNKG